MQSPTKSGIAANRLILNRPKLDELRRAHEITSDAELARRIGVDPVTLYRVSTGRSKASNEFIAGLKAAFPSVALDSLFRVERVEQVRAA
jgi:DNA-binding XRE family transcriptional regulator